MRTAVVLRIRKLRGRITKNTNTPDGDHKGSRLAANRAQDYHSHQTDLNKDQEIASESQLLRLSAEIRNAIYRCVLVETAEIRITSSNIPEDPSLLSVCRQVRRKAKTMYYRANKFAFQIFDYDGIFMVKWLQSSADHAACQCIVKYTGVQNWSNMCAWLKATYEWKIDAGYPVQKGDGEASLLVGVFSMVMRMRKEEKSWGEVERYLDDIHQILTAGSGSWGWVKSA
jgi:hypothetical protein